jgi:phage protein U
MAGVMMILGGFEFKLDTLAYQKLQRSTKQRWAKKERMGQRSAYQWLGKDDDDHTLNGRLLPGFKGDVSALDKLRQMADKGEPYMMVSGYGHVFGKQIILSVDDNRDLFFDDGANERFDFSLKIRRYDDDKPALRSISSALSG